MAFRDVEMCAVKCGTSKFTKERFELRNDQPCAGVDVMNCTRQNVAHIRSSMDSRFYIVNEVLSYRVGPTLYSIENETQESRVRRNGGRTEIKKNCGHRGSIDVRT